MRTELLIAKEDRPFRAMTPVIEPIATLFLNAGTPRLLFFTVALIVCIAFADWSVGNSVSLGILYILPMMSGAIVLNSGFLAVLAIFCSTARYLFDTPGSNAEVALRFVFACVAYYAAGLFVSVLVTNRTLMINHLVQIQREQQLRSNAEQQMQMMIASSSAAILSVAGDGSILATNEAAVDLFVGSSSGSLVGSNIRRYMPVLADAVEMQVTPQTFRTAAQCQGYRGNGEVFQAHTWFSSYSTPDGPRLAAIIVDSSEEMREREGQKFHELARSSRITAAALSHEIHNLCGAIDVLAANLNARHGLALDEDHRAIVTLVRGLDKVASLNLSADEAELETTELREVLNNLRIIIEADWTELEGAVHFPVGPLPNVLADVHGLLQVFLNLAKNSLRAVRDCPEKVLTVSVFTIEAKVCIRFADTGAGVSLPQRLFRLFDSRSDGSGLGLYISRSMARTYGGDLRHEPSAHGAVFVVELQVV